MSSIARFDTWQAADGTNVARYNAGVLEVWNGTSWAEAGTPALEIEYLVIAGGGGGGKTYGAGGGAGGYRCSVVGELSGGKSIAEPKLGVNLSTNYTVTVGAGGAVAAVNTSPGGNGTDSVLGSITSIGGGGGGSDQSRNGVTGGSGGGSSRSGGTAGGNVPSQGFRGQQVNSDPNSAGGGGAGEEGLLAPNGTVAGSDGLASSITGSSVQRAGGGNGYNDTSTEGWGGGGFGFSGTANTGGGGGGDTGNGGSGVVIIKYPNTYNLTVGAGLTYTTSTVGDSKVTQFTAGSDSISFEAA